MTPATKSCKCRSVSRSSRKGNNLASERQQPLPGIVRITRKEIVELQVGTAILTWLQDEEDVVSPHTLTVAAQGVLSALCKDMKRPLPKTVNWINQQPRSKQEKLRNPQNFFKHGHHKQPSKDFSSFAPELTETFLIDNIATYQDLFGSLTVLMTVFALRFSLLHPEGLPLAAFKFANNIVLDSAQTKKLRACGREDFLRLALPIVASRKSGTKVEHS